MVRFFMVFLHDLCSSQPELHTDCGLNQRAVRDLGWRLIPACVRCGQNGDISREESVEIIRQAQVDMSRLNKEAWVLNQAVDSVGRWSTHIYMDRQTCGRGKGLRLSLCVREGGGEGHGQSRCQ